MNGSIRSDERGEKKTDEPDFFSIRPSLDVWSSALAVDARMHKAFAQQVKLPVESVYNFNGLKSSILIQPNTTVET
jgi:hypothetical protein